MSEERGLYVFALIVTLIIVGLGGLNYLFHKESPTAPATDISSTRGAPSGSR